MRLDCIIPARDEAGTVAGNVAAALGCRFVREVIVVDDGSTDDTAVVAAGAGAKVVARAGSSGSKAHALRAGVDASDAELLLFVDADCVGLTSNHLDAVCEPVVAGRAAQSLGTFDYGRFWNRIVLRWSPLTGQRCLPRSVFDAVPADRLDGYTIELRINQVVAESRGRTVVRTMAGVTHRTKRDKFGLAEGTRRTLEMGRDLLAIVWPFGDVGPRLYWRYRRGLTLAPPAPTPPSGGR